MGWGTPGAILLRQTGANSSSGLAVMTASDVEKRTVRRAVGRPVDMFDDEQQSIAEQAGPGEPAPKIGANE